MKAWQKIFDSDDLDEGQKLSGDVKIIENDDGEIIARIEDYEVTTYIQYNSPTYASCNCPKTLPCKHEAALIYYLTDHRELYVREPGFDEIFSNVDEKNLKKFLLKEFKSDEELKRRFLEEFEEISIDGDHYRDKLDRIFKTGEGKDFEFCAIHNLDLMERDLDNFIFNDIDTILSAGEYDLAWELLLRIAELLNDPQMSTYDSWYGLTERFMEPVDTLSTSIYLDARKMDELYSKMDFILEIV